MNPLTWVCLILLVWLLFRPSRRRQRCFDVPGHALVRMMRSEPAHSRLTRTDPDGTRTRVPREV